MKAIDIDLGYELPQKKPLEGRQHVSFLLGAGFSVPKGYPIGKEVNEQFEDFYKKPYVFSFGGKLAIDNQHPSSYMSNIWQKQYDLCNRLILLYKEQYNRFDFEQFFDFIRGKEVLEPYYKDACQDICTSCFGEDYESMVNNLEPIYLQMEEEILRPKNGDIWHSSSEDILHSQSLYKNIIKVIDTLSKESIVNIHTLNHDLLLESMIKSNVVSETLTDGFDDFGSNYYGILRVPKYPDDPQANLLPYRVRLERYTGRYPSALRLFKLHGSLDYAPFWSQKRHGYLQKDRYVKRSEGISVDDLQKAYGAKMYYETSEWNLHPDFLTGTCSKIRRYKEPLLYGKLFRRFKSNLKKSNLLIVIGYGFNDIEINNIINTNFNFKQGKVIVIDPYPSESYHLFSKDKDIRLIKKSIVEVRRDELCMR